MSAVRRGHSRARCWRNEHEGPCHGVLVLSQAQAVFVQEAQVLAMIDGGLWIQRLLYSSRLTAPRGNPYASFSGSPEDSKDNPAS